MVLPKRAVLHARTENGDCYCRRRGMDVHWMAVENLCVGMLPE